MTKSWCKVWQFTLIFANCTGKNTKESCCFIFSCNNKFFIVKAINNFLLLFQWENRNLVFNFFLDTKECYCLCFFLFRTISPLLSPKGGQTIKNLICYWIDHFACYTFFGKVLELMRSTCQIRDICYKCAKISVTCFLLFLLSFMGL